MSLTIAALTLVSALLHPLRDLLMKGTPNPEGGYLAIIMLWVAFAFLHALAFGVDLTTGIAAWPQILVSAVGLFVYYMGVAWTMRRGDLSVYYPIIRATPLVIVVIGALFLGHRYSIELVLGVALVLIGAFFLQYRPGTPLLSEPGVLGLAVVAMIAGGVYSLADASAMQRIEPMVLLFWAYLLLAPCCVVFLAWTRPPGRSVIRHLFGGWRASPVRYLGAALIAYISYTMTLLAYQLGGNVAAVNALRQFSIPVSVLLGGYLLRELRMGHRLLWSLTLAAGIIVIIFIR